MPRRSTSSCRQSAEWKGASDFCLGRNTMRATLLWQSGGLGAAKSARDRALHCKHFARSARPGRSDQRHVQRWRDAVRQRTDVRRRVVRLFRSALAAQSGWVLSVPGRRARASPGGCTWPCGRARSCPAPPPARCGTGCRWQTRRGRPERPATQLTSPTSVEPIAGYVGISGR